MEMTETSLVIFQNAGQPVELRLDAAYDTAWLTQRQIADLFETSTDNVSLHLKNVYETGELGEGAATEESLVVRREGKATLGPSLRPRSSLGNQSSIALSFHSMRTFFLKS